jgi:hypothetical protein
MFGRLGMYHYLPENRDLRNRDVPRADTRREQAKSRAQAKSDDSAMLLRLGIVMLVAVLVIALMRWIAL